MTTKREQVLAAVAAVLAAVRVADVPVVFRRNDPFVERMPEGGLPLLCLMDGDPGEPEVLLSPLTYIYTHRAELEVYVAGSAEDRGPAFDAVVTAAGLALAADRTLGGLCDWIMAEAPAAQDLADEGAAGVRAATITVVLIYGTTDPLA